MTRRVSRAKSRGVDIFWLIIAIFLFLKIISLTNYLLYAIIYYSCSSHQLASKMVFGAQAYREDEMLNFVTVPYSEEGVPPRQSGLQVDFVISTTCSAVLGGLTVACLFLDIYGVFHGAPLRGHIPWGWTSFFTLVGAGIGIELNRRV